MPLPIKGAARSAASLALAMLPVAGLMLFAEVPQTARVADQVAFTIPAEEGYGLEDCLHSGNACGQAVANSWCQSHGHLKAVAFGTVSDVTGAIPTPATPQAADSGSVLIRCGD